MALQFFIKNLCLEIQEECKKLNLLCHQNFMTYYLTLLAYDPIWNLFPSMVEIDRNEALRLINFVVTKMGYPYCPSMVTLRIQFYFTCNFENRDHIFEIHQHNLSVKLKPLVCEIKTSIPKTNEDYEHILKQIIYYSTVWCDLGNPLHPNVYKESYYALRSIFDKEDLQEFVGLNMDKKFEQLLDIAATLAGVRLFNWTCKIGGAGINDIPKCLGKSLNDLKAELVADLDKVVDDINMITSGLDYCFVIEDVHQQTEIILDIAFKQTCMLSNNVEYEDIEHLKDMLIIRRQQEIFIKKLLNATTVLMNNHESHGKDFKKCLAEFESTKFLRSWAPMSLIVPMFKNLNKIWMSYQKEVIYMQRMKTIHHDLEIYCKELLIPYDVLDDLLNKRNTLNDNDRNMPRDESEYMFSLNCSPSAEIILPDSEKYKLDEMQFWASGFDIWRLVESQGGLIPGNPKIGVILYRGNHFIFTCRESAYMFALNPKRVFNEVIMLARKKVELINLLKIQDEVAEVRTMKELCTKFELAEASNLGNRGQQTEVHATQVFWDENYKWNIWDHKRQALNLFQISVAKTTQTQPVESYSKIGSSTQTSKGHDVSLQTIKDNYSNTSRPSAYFFGLRGRKDNRQCNLDLTLPPEFGYF